jgi:hypothetical protein
MIRCENDHRGIHLPREPDNSNKQEVSINRRLPGRLVIAQIVLQMPDTLFGGQQTSLAGGYVKPRTSQSPAASSFWR